MVWNEVFSLTLTNPAIRTVATAVVRSVLGWIENSIASGEWKFQWKRLVETFARTLPQALGLTAAGVAPEAALLTDWVGVKVANSMKK